MAAELLAVDGVCKGFWRGRSWLGVLKDVSFGVDAGEVVAVIGPRLGGKTTLLQVAAGMECADSGCVTLAGRALGDRGERRRLGRGSAGGRERSAPVLGRDVVWVGRDGPHQELEVSKYVGWPLAVHGGRRRDARVMAARALERVGAEDCVSRCWGELSNWQRVLVGLARGFAGSPHVVVIDDLLDGLGSRDTEVASDLLHSLVEESEPRCAVLMSAGYFDTAVVIADQVWALTPRGTLTRRSGRRPSFTDERDDVVVPFPKHAETQGSRSTGPT
jgi:predicted ABC-type transport system involved in lysophospholipase L1 biosynthesis ATPase subunit